MAPEGLNCTLTGKPNDIRSFCYALREWDDVFSETDFKITDGLPLDKLFKSLSIRKTNELVAYGLAGGKSDVSCSLRINLDMTTTSRRTMTIKPVICERQMKYLRE